MMVACGCLSFLLRSGVVYMDVGFLFLALGRVVGAKRAGCGQLGHRAAAHSFAMIVPFDPIVQGRKLVKMPDVPN